jgi:hypothetical protein
MTHRPFKMKGWALLGSIFGRIHKKTGVIEYLQVFGHAGLLANEPPGLVRVALHLVVRRFLLKFFSEPNAS